MALVRLPDGRVQHRGPTACGKVWSTYARALTCEDLNASELEDAVHAAQASADQAEAAAQNARQMVLRRDETLSSLDGRIRAIQDLQAAQGDQQQRLEALAASYEAALAASLQQRQQLAADVAALQQALAAEQRRAVATEAELQAQLAAETTRAKAAEQAGATAAANAAAAAAAAASAVTAETSRAKSAEQAVAAAVTAERDRALAAEKALAAAEQALRRGLVHPPFAPGQAYGPTGQSDAIHDLAFGVLEVVPILVPAGSAPIRGIACEVTYAGPSGRVVRMGVWEDNGAGAPGKLLIDAGTVRADTAGGKVITFPAPLTVDGYVWVGAVGQGVNNVIRGPEVRGVMGYTPGVRSVMSTVAAAALAVVGPVTGALPASPAVMADANGGPRLTLIT